MAIYTPPIVSRETAKLLNKLGYDWSTKVTYYEKGENGKTIFFKAPTLEEVQAWLRLKYFLYTMPHPLSGNLWTYKVFEMAFVDVNPPHAGLALSLKVEKKSLNSYEEAVEAGIIHCLSFITKSKPTEK